MEEREIAPIFNPQNLRERTLEINIRCFLKTNNEEIMVLRYIKEIGEVAARYLQERTITEDHI
jgi:hypothetical protein